MAPLRSSGTNRRNKALASALVVGVLGTVAAGGVFGLFSATTQNAGNEISTGIVALSDNDNGTAQFNVTNAKPGDSWTRCIKVSYAGTLPADVREYLQGTVNPLAPYLQLKIERGTQVTSTFPDCTDFVATGTLFDGLASANLARDFDSGLVTVPAGQTFWQPTDSIVIRTTLTLGGNAPDTVQGQGSGIINVIWEARNH
jgi:hypothetical protein